MTIYSIGPNIKKEGKFHRYRLSDTSKTKNVTDPGEFATFDGLMLISRYILIAVLATLISVFAIELPYTQVNYIHFIVGKKIRTAAARAQTYIHKTYYEDEQKPFFPLVFPVVILAFVSLLLSRPMMYSFPRPSPSFRSVNSLRGPPLSLR